MNRKRNVAGVCLLAMSAFAAAVEPIPSFYDEPGLSRNRDYVDQHTSEKVDPFTGKLQLHQVDLFIPGNGGLDIKVQRSYNSIDRFLERVEPTTVGVGWTMHFGRVVRAIGRPCEITQTPAEQPVLELPDGSRHVLYVAFDNASWQSTSRWRAVCGLNGLLRVFSPEGTRYDMNFVGPVSGRQNSWYVTQITDRNGNTLDLSYRLLAGRVGVDAVRASDGRLVNFTYDGFGRLETVTDGARTWRYRFIESPRAGSSYPFLQAVIRPDGTGWQFDYYLGVTGSDAGSHSMQRLRYPTGGALEYTYGFEVFNVNLPKTTVVESKLDSLGHRWTFSYAPATHRCVISGVQCSFDDGSHDTTTVIHPDGVVHEFAHIGANSVHPGMVWAIGLPLRTVIDRAGNAATEVTSYQWAASAALSPVLNVRPAGLPTELFDRGVFAPLLLRQQIVRNGAPYSTAYADFDVFGNARSVTETGPDGRGGLQSRTTTRSFFTDTARWIIRVPKNETTTGVGSVLRDHDANGNLRSESRYGVTTSFTHHPDGEVRTRTDARGNTVTYSDYFRGIARLEEHPEGVLIARSVSPAGNVMSQTDGEVHTVGYDYDGLNRLRRIDHPLGLPVTVEWSANQRVVTRGDFRQTTQFDGFGRVAGVNSQDLSLQRTITQAFRHDSYGRRVFASYPGSVKGERTSFDPLGRPFRIEHAVADTQPQRGVASRRHHVANRVEVTNERGFLTTYTYRGWGTANALELMGIAAPRPDASVSIARNGLGQPETVTQGGKTRRFRYDTRYFLDLTEEPETGVTQFGRDEIGNMIWRQVGSAPRTTFTYDGRNRLKTINYPAGTASVTRTYYRDDTLKSVETSEARRDYTYDANKNIRTESVLLPAVPKSMSVRYLYDDKDALAGVVFGSGRQISYSPDAFGWPTRAVPYATTVEHHPNGAPARIVYTNGVETTFTLNDRYWVENILAAKAPSQISDLRYTFDELGNVKSIADASDPAAARTLSYDEVDRLAGFTSPRVPQGLVVYDGRGNIRRNASVRADMVLDYGYDPVSERLTSLTTSTGPFSTSIALDYDAYGNVIGMGPHRFGFDDASRMTCWRCGEFDEMSYTYDGDGMRVMTRDRNSGPTSFYMYSKSGRLLWEELSSGEVREFIYVGGRQIATRVTRP